MKILSTAVAAVGAMALVVGCQSGSDGKMSKADKPMAKPDADMQEVLTALADLKPQPIENLTAEEARRQPGPPDAVLKVQQKKSITPPRYAGTIANQSVPGPAGQVPVRVWTPAGDGPFPVIVYSHGGGFVIASVDAYAASCEALSTQAKAIVISVDYRMAPEHQFPASHEDVYAVYTHVVKNAQTMKGDPKKIAVAGESAGGNLATAVCLMAKDRGQPLPVYQLLVYPVTNNDMNTESYVENANAKPLNKAMMAWFFEKETNSPADANNPYLMPLKASSDKLKGLPPATIVAAEIDPLRTEGKQYADKLKAAGVDVRYKLYEGSTHEFFGMATVVKDAKDAQAFAVEGLNTAFKK